MIDEPKIACFEKQAKTRLVKEMLKTIGDLDAINAPLKPGESFASKQNLYNNVVGPRWDKLQKAYAKSKSYSKINGATLDHNGRLVSTVTGYELPRDPLARRIILANELEHGGDYIGYSPASSMHRSDMRSFFTGGDGWKDRAIEGIGTPVQSDEYVRNAILPYLKDAEATTGWQNKLKEFYNARRAGNKGLLFGLDDAAGGFGKAGVDAPTADFRYVGALPLGNARIPTYINSRSVNTAKYGANGSNSQVDPIMQRGMVQLDRNMYTADDASRYWTGMKSLSSVLEHELGHSYMGGLGEHEMRNRIARRLAVELRRLKRLGLKTSLDNKELLLEASGTYAPTVLRGNKSAILREGIKAGGKDHTTDIPWYSSLSPEMKNVVSQLVDNYGII